jgi:hypothetical protein
MTIPLLILSIGSIFFGYLFKEAIIGIGSPFLGASIFISPFQNGGDQFINGEFIDSTVK